jgi:hypothetical protein
VVVAVAVVVGVGAPVIVAVHLNGNAPVGVIAVPWSTVLKRGR